MHLYAGKVVPGPGLSREPAAGYGRDLLLFLRFVLLLFREIELTVAGPGLFELLAVVDAGADDFLILLGISAPDPARAVAGPMLPHVPRKPLDHRIESFIVGVQVQSVFLCVFRRPCPDVLLDGVRFCLLSAGVRHDYFLMPVFAYEVIRAFRESVSALPDARRDACTLLVVLCDIRHHIRDVGPGIHNQP